MYIEDITIKNFRVYYGTNHVDLATGTDKNISIISGNNGFGKTSFLTSLIWCLYGRLMGDVDTRYRQEIYDSGGYKSYCKKLMNVLADHDLLQGGTSLFIAPGENTLVAQPEKDDPSSFSVSMRFSELMIPSVPCRSVQVTRTYNITRHQEDVEILIDGKPNELTKQVGPEIFINDFILPKEIAKFFFFDAEKIVSLAEIKNSDEKVYLSQAYAEVLGIKKYTDLRSNLLNTRLRLREKSAHKSDRSKLEKLQTQLNDNEKLISQLKLEIQINQDSLISKKAISDNYQIQLIREGSSLSIEEIKSMKERQAKFNDEMNKVRHRFHELLELAPFAISGNKMKQVKQQIELEVNHSSGYVSLLENKFAEIELRVESGMALLSISNTQKDALMTVIKDILLPEVQKEQKILLDFTTEQQNRFNAIYDNLQDSYSKTFKRLVTEQRRLQFAITTLQRKLANAESKENDVVIQRIRNAKSKIDLEISALEEELNNLEARIFNLQQENQTFSRQLSELSKKVQMETVDIEKDQVAERLIGKLDKFIYQLKAKKKNSLERSLTTELNRLMHKDFVHQAKVLIEGDLIDIELYDSDGKVINKESLSKGEQQLYATALLKALVDESNIRFPIFIDSPMQKFDKTHSRNIVEQFYSNVSGQLILFPLLKNELSEEEYETLLPKVGKTYLIRQIERYHSAFSQAEPVSLFNLYSSQYVQ